MIAISKPIFCQIALLFFLAVFISGCAEIESGSSSTSNMLKAFFTKERPKVTGVKMINSDEASRLDITATSSFKYIAYRFRHPDRLAIEMKGIDNNIVGDILARDDDLIEKIKLINFEKSGHVRAEIYVKQPFVYDIHLDGSILKIAIMADESEVLMEYRNKLKKAEERIAWLEMRLREAGKVGRSVDDIEKQEELMSADDPAAEAGAEEDLAALRDNFDDDTSAIEAKEEEEEKIESKEPEQDKTSPEEESPGVSINLHVTIDGWLTAWRTKDIDAYGAYYDSSFTARKKGRGAWIERKKKSFAKPGEISIDIENVEITVDGENATVKFLQMYKTKKYSDKGVKTLTMKLRDGAWKIVSEIWKQAK